MCRPRSPDPPGFCFRCPDHAILNRAQERDLAARRDACDALAHDPTLSQDRREEAARDRDAARNQLVECHLKLGFMIARSFCKLHPSMRIEDAQSAAYTGLMAAAARFNPDLAGFGAYGGQAVHRALWTAFEELRWPVRLPANARSRKPGRVRPAIAECAKRVRSARIFGTARQKTDYDPLGELTAPEPDDESIAIDRVDVARRLDDLINERLTGIEARIIRLSYGLDGSEPRTLRQIVDVVGYTPQGVKVIRTRGLDKLRYALGGQEVRPTRRSILAQLRAFLATAEIDRKGPDLIEAFARATGQVISIRTLRRVRCEVRAGRG